MKTPLTTSKKLFRILKASLSRLAAGVSLLAVLSTFAPRVLGQTFEMLQSISANLIQGRDGNIYGTTSGIPTGILFKLTANGGLMTLASVSNATNGLGPIVQGSDGNFYGTTPLGGDRSLNAGLVMALSLN